MAVDELDEATEEVLVHSIAEEEDDVCDMTAIPRVKSAAELLADKCFIGYLSCLLVLATTSVGEVCGRCAAAVKPVVPSQIGTAIVLTWVGHILMTDSVFLCGL